MKFLAQAIIDIGYKPLGFLVSFAIMKTILDPKSRRLSASLTVFLVGIPLGMLVYYISREWQLGENTSIGLACVCVLLGERIIWAIMNINVDDIITQAIKKVIGKK